MPKRPRESIHFVFKHHDLKKEPYLPKRYLRNTKTHVYEEAGGTMAPMTMGQMSRAMLQYWVAKKLGVESESPLHHPFQKSMVEYLGEALKRGQKILPGELAQYEHEIQRIAHMEREEHDLYGVAHDTRNLADIAHYFWSAANLIRERHHLILRTLKTAETPLVGRFGVIHSTLSRELQKQGIASSRELPEQVFTPLDRVLLKLFAGKRPSNMDYKKGMIDEQLWAEIKELPQTDAQARFQSLVHAVLLDHLDENQIDTILRTDQLGLAYVWNGMPIRPTKRQLLRFLQKNSSFYRRQQTIHRMKRKTN